MSLPSLFLLFPNRGRGNGPSQNSAKFVPQKSSSWRLIPDEKKQNCDRPYFSASILLTVPQPTKVFLALDTSGPYNNAINHESLFLDFCCVLLHWFCGRRRWCATSKHSVYHVRRSCCSRHQRLWQCGEPNPQPGSPGQRRHAFRAMFRCEFDLHSQSCHDSDRQVFTHEWGT